MASFMALGAGFLAALAIVQMRLISKTSSTYLMLFYYFLISTLVSGVFAWPQWKMPATFEMCLF